ncbi:MAG: 30S ribosome-binding factor RbfA [bacterium]|nr:30S ribosome-binding factor RbfA [bacterium]
MYKFLKDSYIGINSYFVKMTTRQQKVNSLIQRQVSEHLLKERFDGITGVVTITGVDTTEDLEYSKVFFSVIGQEAEEVIKVLKENIYEIQGTLNRKLTMRKVPRISFVFDSSGEYAAHIRRIMREVKDDSPDRPLGEI